VILERSSLLPRFGQRSDPCADYEMVEADIDSLERMIDINVTPWCG
jgi:hypothetical protein